MDLVSTPTGLTPEQRTVELACLFQLIAQRLLRFLLEPIEDRGTAWDAMGRHETRRSEVISSM